MTPLQVVELFTTLSKDSVVAQKHTDSVSETKEKVVAIEQKLDALLDSTRKRLATLDASIASLAAPSAVLGAPTSAGGALTGTHTQTIFEASYTETESRSPFVPLSWIKENFRAQKMTGKSDSPGCMLLEEDAQLLPSLGYASAGHVLEVGSFCG